MKKKKVKTLYQTLEETNKAYTPRAISIMIMGAKAFKALLLDRTRNPEVINLIESIELGEDNGKH